MTLAELGGTSRMMREMAQQLRDLTSEKSIPVTRRVRELANQLEQEADVLEAEISSRLSHSARLTTPS
jgi:DNA-directed RNA polymerase specialized sigma subunit